MSKEIRFRSVAMAAVLGLAVVSLTSGCATRKYVRARVDERAGELSSRIDNSDRSIQTHSGEIQANSNQIQELGSVTRDHSQKIAGLDGGLKATDEKAGHALSIGEGAQGKANQAIGQVSSLDQKFQNRNNYVVLSEDKVKFKFNSATIEKAYLKVLDEAAQRVKESPDAILVMEGHTDSVGDEAYNIRLGEKRLEAVIRYLVVEQGVPMHKVYRLSFGKDRPLSANNTRDGRAENRAVMMRIMGPNLGAGKEAVLSSAATPEQ